MKRSKQNPFSMLALRQKAQPKRKARQMTKKSKATYKPSKAASKFIKVKKELYAEQLRSRRKALKMSQDRLAYLTGLDRKTINRIENGHYSPSLDTMLRIALVLKLNASEAIII